MVKRFSEIGENKFPFRIKKWKKTNIVFTIFFAIACFQTIFDTTGRVDQFVYIGLIFILIFYVIVINVIDYLTYSAVKDLNSTAKDVKEAYEKVKKDDKTKRANFNKVDQERIKKDADDLDLEL